MMGVAGKNSQASPNDTGLWFTPFVRFFTFFLSNKPIRCLDFGIGLAFTVYKIPDNETTMCALSSSLFDSEGIEKVQGLLNLFQKALPQK
jgi:hypothetical protein